MNRKQIQTSQNELSKVWRRALRTQKQDPDNWSELNAVMNGIESAQTALNDLLAKDGKGEIK